MTNTHVSDVFITVAPPLVQRGWFIAIGYQIPFEGGRRWQQWLTEIRPLADNASRRAIRVPERCLPGVQLPYLFVKNLFFGSSRKPSSTRARTGDLSRVKRT